MSMHSKNSKKLDFLGFPDYYISQNGEVYSTHYNKPLKAGKTTKGYLKVVLQKKKKKKNFLIHRLVALAFIPNPNNFDTVDHIDGNLSNNNIDNLRWMPRSANAKRGWDKGGHDRQMKKVLKILDGAVISEYNSIAHAAREFGVDASNISRACSQGRKCKGYEWRYY